MRFDYFYGEQAEQFTFYRIPKLLFTEGRFKTLSTDAKLLYGLFLDRMNLSARKGWIDEEGRVYIVFQIEEIMEAMGCSDNKALRILTELEKDVGLIERKRRGLGKPNLIFVKNFVSGNPESLKGEVLNRDFEDSGIVKTKIAESPEMRRSEKDKKNNYWNNKESFFFQPGMERGSETVPAANLFPDRVKADPSPELQLKKEEEEERRTCPGIGLKEEKKEESEGGMFWNGRSGKAEPRPKTEERTDDGPEAWAVPAANLLDLVEADPLPGMRRTEEEWQHRCRTGDTNEQGNREESRRAKPGAEVSENYHEYFQRRFDLDRYKQRYPGRAELMDEILELLTGVCQSGERMIRLGREEKPLEAVRNRMMKLDQRHLDYAFEMMEQSTVPIRNLRQYLLTVLYNATLTLESYQRTKKEPEDVLREAKDAWLLKCINEMEV